MGEDRGAFKTNPGDFRPIWPIFERREAAWQRSRVVKRRRILTNGAQSLR
jgi:hypothetical protein